MPTNIEKYKAAKAQLDWLKQSRLMALNEPQSTDSVAFTLRSEVDSSRYENFSNLLFEIRQHLSAKELFLMGLTRAIDAATKIMERTRIEAQDEAREILAEVAIDVARATEENAKRIQEEIQEEAGKV